MSAKVTWVDRGLEPKNKPNPDFPHGIDIDVSHGGKTCTFSLPYPARRCGYYVIECGTCGHVSVASTAGRPDDPRSLKVSCRTEVP